MSISTQTRPAETELRRWVYTTIVFSLAFGLLHHIDHLVRGVHLGWPLIPIVTPYTYSLLFEPLMLIGLYFTVRGRTLAVYWLLVSFLTLGLVVVTHLLPQAVEPLASVYQAYTNPLFGGTALIIFFGLLISLGALASIAVRLGMVTRRWW